ncbi:kirola-like [Rhodamnia argentea]|uniref:Kirola-like n=1 Tax=Rhodamnia argentea TaxID=178133 RepID=A0A8B8P5D9_9MYRT|nr:kirola-like [Rhodamnia argentea]
MAQLGKFESQLELKSPAEKVFDIFRRKSYLFPKIVPQMVKDVKLVSGDWESVGSVRLWNYVAGDCESGKETVEAFADDPKSITFTYLDGAAMDLYKSLKVGFQFSSEGEHCMTKKVLAYEKRNANVPDADKYLEFTCGMLPSVDAYLLKA